MWSRVYEAGPNGPWIFLLLTVAIGGVTAWVTGRAIAQSWRPQWQLPLYVMLLALAVRFLHFALFDELLISIRNFVVDSAVLMIAGVFGYKSERTYQMSTQYSWLYQGSGLLGWRRRD